MDVIRFIGWFVIKYAVEIVLAVWLTMWTIIPPALLGARVSDWHENDVITAFFLHALIVVIALVGLFAGAATAVYGGQSIIWLIDRWYEYRQQYPPRKRKD